MNQNRSKTKTVVRVIAFLLVAALLYGALSRLLAVNDATEQQYVHSFYLEPKNSLDVMILGASETFTDYCAPLAWQHAGFTSYPLAVSAAQGTMYPSMLREAARRQTPGVYVVEVNGFLYTAEERDEFSHAALRKWIDTIPLSANKLDTIRTCAYDFTVYGGSLSASNARKIVKVQQLALKNGAPIIALNDSGGARIQEGIESLSGYANIFYQNTIASGVIPQISAILGPCAGGACYSPALTDFIFMVKEKSHMFVTGPDVVKTVIHEEVSKEELGGAMTHSSKSGVTHFMANSEEELLMSIRELLSFLPQNNMDETRKQPCTDEINREDESLNTIVPTDPNVPYDMKEIIERVVDNGYFFEVMPYFAKNIIIGFARLGGRSVGIVANQPAYLAGVLDIDASDKASRFIRFCDCFNIPLITFDPGRRSR